MVDGKCRLTNPPSERQLLTLSLQIVHPTGDFEGKEYDDFHYVKGCFVAKAPLPKDSASMQSVEESD
jgi:hypothetical protein